MKYRFTNFKCGATCLLYVFVLFLTSCEETLGPSSRISAIKREVPDCPPFQLSYQKVDNIPGVTINPLQNLRQFLQGKAFKAILSVAHMNKLSLYMVSTQPEGLFRIWEEDDLLDRLRTNWKTRLGKDEKINFDIYSSLSLDISPDGKFVSYQLFVENPKSGENVQMVWISELASVARGWQYHLNSSHCAALGLRFTKKLWQGTVVAPYLVFQRYFNKIFFYYSLQPPVHGSLSHMSKIQSSVYLERIFSDYQVSGDSNIVVEPYGKMVDYYRKAEGEPYILERQYSPPPWRDIPGMPVIMTTS